MTTQTAATKRNRKHRPRWVPTLAALVTAVLCIVAGNWQHRRMQEKQALEARMQEAAALAPVALPTSADDWRAWRFRRVIATGEYDAQRQIIIDNKVHRGVAGYDIVTPLRLADGSVLLVDRGWIAAGPSRAVLPQSTPPAGTVAVGGRIDIAPRDYYELGDRSPPTGPLWQHLDPARFAAATGMRVLPIVVDATDASAGDDLERDFPLPDAGIEKHLSYMIQWYTFAAMAAGLWVWFTLRPWLLRRAHDGR